MFRFYLKRAFITIMVVLILIYAFGNYNPSLKKVVQVYLEGLPSPPSQFVIDSPKCKILNLNPFDKSILQYINKTKKTECAAYPPLTTVTYNPFLEKHVLQVNYSALRYYTNSFNIRCCVKKMRGDVLNLVFGPCQRFYDVVIIKKVNEFSFVYCLDDNGDIIYSNMHAATVKVKKVNSGRKKDPNKLNVLLLGFDSMSRLNFYRTLPKTATYLHTHGWTEMKGYNKIADNTLPNMMAFLSGLSPGTFQRAHRLNFDNMPYIWKEFSSAGYITAYAEDQPLVSTFHCHLSGFNHLPTDHYFRDYIYAGELLLMGNGRPPGCIADRLAIDHVFDYLLDFVTVYKTESFFGLFWANQISHNDLNRASGEDDNVFELVKQLTESGTTNTTMVVLLSDHGLRVGDFRRSKHGWYEDRLPLLFISIPEWYKNQNVLHYSNLLKNSERLTSPYDLYLTMKHVLYGRESSPPSGCRSCRSLFTEVPPDRSCPEAGISPHWCTCYPASDVSNSDYTTAVAERVVQAINAKVASDPDVELNFECEPLKLRTILYIREKSKPEVQELIVGIVTDPGGAEFEATVTFHEHHLSVEDSISRLNEYGNESSCAENPINKLFCHCKEVFHFTQDLYSDINKGP